MQKILDAARKEFGSKGFEGARVEAIARGAGVVKGLIFYYFENKEGLFHALAKQRTAPGRWVLVEDLSRDDPFQWPMSIFSIPDETIDWVKFFLWEGLDSDWENVGPDGSHPRMVMEETRKQGFTKRVADVRLAQSQGLLPPQMDAEQLTFLLYILGVYPYMAPQFAYLITGRAPTEPEFRDKYRSMLRFLAELMRHAAGTDTSISPNGAAAQQAPSSTEAPRTDSA